MARMTEVARCSPTSRSCASRSRNSAAAARSALPCLRSSRRWLTASSSTALLTARARARGAEVPAGGACRDERSARSTTPIVKGKRVLVRVDLNVPMENGRVADGPASSACCRPSSEIADKGGKVDPLVPFRPAEGPRRQAVPEAGRCSRSSTSSAGRSPSPRTASARRPRRPSTAMKDGDVLLLENTRFHAGEEKNDPAFAKALAKLGDVYVNDAFSAAHRAHASTEGLAHLLPAYAGRAMQAELEALAKGLEAPARPVVAVVGGAKVSTKIDLLENLVAQGRRPRHRRRHGQHLPARDRHRRRRARSPSATSARRRSGSWTRRARPTAPSSCRSTPSSRASSRRTRRTTPTASTRSRPTA